MQEDYLRGRGPPVKDTTRMLQALAGIAAARCRWDLPTDQQGALEQTVPLEWSSDGQKWPGACALLGSVMSLRRGGGAVSIWRHGSGERWALSWRETWGARLWVCQRRLQRQEQQVATSWEQPDRAIVCWMLFLCPLLRGDCKFTICKTVLYWIESALADKVSACVKVAQLYSTFCDPMDCPPGSPLSLGMLQARILEWVAIPFSRGSSQTRDRTQLPCFIFF